VAELCGILVQALMQLRSDAQQHRIKQHRE
jgi:hypothetical protein